MTKVHADAPWSTLLDLLRGHRRPLGLALLLTLGAATLELVPYALLCESAALLLAQARAHDVWRLVGWMALALAGKYLLYALAYYLSHRAAYRVLMDTRQALVRRLVWAPLTWLQQHGSGALKQLLMQDVERLEQFIAHHLVEMTAALVAPILVAGVLLWIDWRLALAAVATLPLAILLQSITMRNMDRFMAQYQQAVGELSSASVEYLRSMPVMKTFRQNARSFGRMREGLARYHDLARRVTRSTVPGWSIFMVLLNANIVLLLPLGLWLEQRQQIGLSELLLALVLGSGMLKPLFKLMRFQAQIREILEGIRRMQPLLAMHEPAPRAPAAIGPPDLCLDGVCLDYGAAPVLSEVSFRVAAGQVTALVGPSGAGKTSVANVLGGLIEANRGAVRIGGAPLCALSEAQRAGLISVVAQDAFLFQGSLLENLRLVRPDAQEAQLRRALRIAQAEAFVDALPEGWHTGVGEAGISLSGGERQRIAVARALLADTPILVLDESTAFADSRTEWHFFQALREACPEKTLLVIAHRLYAVKDAAQIVVLQAGRLLDAGDHDSLLRRCALYRQMWEAQGQGDAWTLQPARGAGRKEVEHG
ncbi:ABC transporter ATP-binding protein [Verminephrobacter aporrectodeae subsp. tuberculatae]|uniref:ABC transporter ATP-binding protein n=1 Tax=Verminephrobacter aporrectodeae TaxID=1110389 RepID=UPI002243887F|nr:ABC transporter ATP-binding protein [Verminephrobacter aporrectodeae]MCW8207540.1 ABC transporter ATP-binding protein [Verminephrobacter aporrectodeae subsp. tuberculatae]